MSEQNKAFVRRWFEDVWTQKCVATIDELFPSDAVVHGLGGDRQGPGAFKAFHSAYCGAFPDLTIRIDDMIAEGDKVAFRWHSTGTHRGDDLGFKATNRPTAIEGMGIVRVVDGKLVEGWNLFDQAGMMKQLGLMPETV